MLQPQLQLQLFPLFLLPLLPLLPLFPLHSILPGLATVKARKKWSQIV